MDLGFSAEEIAFRAEVREFVAKNLPAAIRDKLAAGHHPSKDDIVTWTRILARQGLGRAALAGRMGRHGLGRDQAVDLHRRDPARPRARIAGLRHQHGRAGDLHVRLAGAEGAVPAAHPRSQRLVVPGLLRARRRLGSGGAAHQGRARRRFLGHRRAEDLDDARPARRLDFRARPHRPEREEAGGHLLLPLRHEDAGRHGAPDPDHRRRPRGQRGVLRQCAHPRREHRRRGQQGLGLREIPALQRAQRHRPRRRLQGAARQDPPARLARRLRRQAEDGGPRFPHEARRRRGRTEGAGDDADARHRRQPHGAEGQAEPDVLGAQDQGLGVAAGHDRAC